MATEKREPLSAQRRALLASPLSIKSASIFRAGEAGTGAFKMRFSRPGTTLERLMRHRTDPQSRPMQLPIKL
jgi:hypothetical protein